MSLQQEKELQDLLNKLKLEETLSMIRILALNFTSNTNVVITSPGLRSYVISEYNPVTDRKEEIRLVNLIEFFGMHVGYDPKSDLLVYWRNEEVARDSLILRFRNEIEKAVNILSLLDQADVGEALNILLATRRIL